FFDYSVVSGLIVRPACQRFQCTVRRSGNARIGCGKLFAGRNFKTASGGRFRPAGWAGHGPAGISRQTLTSGIIAAMSGRWYRLMLGYSNQAGPMHQMVSTPVDSSRRWWVLAIVVSAQFMFGVDAFVVNVAIPTIARELHASSAEIEAVIAIYLIAYATLVVTGGRLG